VRTGELALDLNEEEWRDRLAHAEVPAPFNIFAPVLALT
jgi:hypothetical protein